MERDANLEELKGKEVKFRLIELSQRGRRRKIIGSIKSVLVERKAEAAKKIWDEIHALPTEPMKNPIELPTVPASIEVRYTSGSLLPISTRSTVIMNVSEMTMHIA